MPWTTTHGSECATVKYQLLHLSRKKTYRQVHQLQISGTIHPRSIDGDITYLGVHLDPQIKWGPQVELARNKVAKGAEAMKRTAGSVRGASVHDLRKIYRAVAVSQMKYTCSVWARA